ncbi:hypothetical protein OG21DRAFT_1105488 [Imleria badia]|nr:hypothetical protein OG21DRAFT_1105488 [Imleria badia]
MHENGLDQIWLWWYVHTWVQTLIGGTILRLSASPCDATQTPQATIICYIRFLRQSDLSCFFDALDFH